jgi:hypothetical protein
LVNIGLSADFDENRFAHQALEGRAVSGGGPQFELGIARRSDLQQAVVAPIVELDAGDRL